MMSHLTILSYKKKPPNKEATTSQKPVKECDSKNTNKPIEQKNPTNSNICFLCGRKGHYGSQTSCYASKQIKKNYFN